MLRKAFLALGLAVAAWPAAAADYKWAGLYVGGNVGRGTATITDRVVVPGATLFTSEDLSGLIGGAQIGYNVQMGAFVLGLETDLQATGQKATGTTTSGVITTTTTNSIPWFGTMRGRVGLALDRFLVYGTVGAAYGQVKSESTTTVAGIGTGNSSVTTSGVAWTLGAGVEVAFASSFSVRIEYLYLDTGTVATSYPIAGFGTVSTSAQLTDNILRAGVNYRF